jgi:hypothetical protein
VLFWSLEKLDRGITRCGEVNLGKWSRKIKPKILDCEHFWFSVMQWRGVVI